MPRKKHAHASEEGRANSFATDNEARKPVNTNPTAGRTATVPTNRWQQLVVAVMCMVMIANLQYGWTLFVSPMNKAHGWSLADIQVAFSLFVALETWLTPIEGWIVDCLGPRRGPKLMVAFGGVLIAIAWIINAQADIADRCSMSALSLSGIGAGAVYATCVGNAVKWFPDRRGLAVGLTAAGLRRRRGADRHSDPRA